MILYLRSLLAEAQLPKQRAVGSNPIARSRASIKENSPSLTEYFEVPFFPQARTAANRLGRPQTASRRRASEAKNALRASASSAQRLAAESGIALTGVNDGPLLSKQRAVKFTHVVSQAGH